jgi:hypothetical protein
MTTNKIDVNSQPGEIGKQIVKEMASLTLEKNGDWVLGIARENQKFLSKGKSLRDLRGLSIAQGDSAIIIAAGPSLHENNVAAKIKSAQFKGAIVTADSSILYCLRNGIIPDLIVTIDPHAKRIVRWFGDSSLTESDLESDDYFSRQDMDPAFSDQMKTNQETLDLVNKYGKQMKIALSTSASPAVVQRALESGMDIYWWNPILDDPELPDGKTRELYELNGLPCLNAGGNVGTACWMMAYEVLGKKNVALTGMDFSYFDKTPYRNTQYYYQAVDLVGEENLDSIYMRLHNPHIDKWFYTDPAYMWYRECFLELAAESDCVTYNCTEGGILFGQNIRFLPLEEFLKVENTC